MGLCQQQQWPQWPQWPQGTQRTRRAVANRPGVWWALGSAAVWGAVALASLGGEGRLRAVDLRLALPVAAVCSLVGGAAVLLAAAGGRGARPAP